MPVGRTTNAIKLTTATWGSGFSLVIRGPWECGIGQQLQEPPEKAAETLSAAQGLPSDAS